MINLTYAKRFCKEYWLIENYDQAMADKSQTWHCHHRRETEENLSREILISAGHYYDVHYSELIFLTPEEHISLHHKGKEGTFKGKHHTEETKAKMSDALKGRQFTEEWKQKISDAIESKGGYSGENNPNYKYHITKEELYDLYVVQGLSTYKIAELYGCGQSCIWLKLKKFNIKKHKNHD